MKNQIPGRDNHHPDEPTANSTGTSSKPDTVLNAFHDSLRANQPVLSTEQVEKWQAHWQGVQASLQPVGTLELALTERVAQCLWRLNRVVRYETAITSLNIHEVEEDIIFQNIECADADQGRSDQKTLDQINESIAQVSRALVAFVGVCALFQELLGLSEDAPVEGRNVYRLFLDLNDLDPDIGYFEFEDEEFLLELGVAVEQIDDPFGWDDWTAGMVRQGVEEMAAELQINAGQWLQLASMKRNALEKQREQDLENLHIQAGHLRQRIAERSQRMQLRRLIPATHQLQTVMNYESHLNHQMHQALETLARFQAARAKS